MDIDLPQNNSLLKSLNLNEDNLFAGYENGMICIYNITSSSILLCGLYNDINICKVIQINDMIITISDAFLNLWKLINNKYVLHVCMPINNGHSIINIDDTHIITTEEGCIMKRDINTLDSIEIDMIESNFIQSYNTNMFSTIKYNESDNNIIVSIYDNNVKLVKAYKIELTIQLELIDNFKYIINETNILIVSSDNIILYNIANSKLTYYKSNGPINDIQQIDEYIFFVVATKDSIGVHTINTINELVLLSLISMDEMYIEGNPPYVFNNKGNSIELLYEYKDKQNIIRKFNIKKSDLDSRQNISFQTMASTSAPTLLTGLKQMLYNSMSSYDMPSCQFQITNISLPESSGEVDIDELRAALMQKKYIKYKNKYLTLLANSSKHKK